MGGESTKGNYYDEQDTIDAHDLAQMATYNKVTQNGVLSANGVAPTSHSINNAHKSTGFSRLLIKLLFHGGIPALCLRLFLLAAIFLSVGVPGLFFYPNSVNIGPIPLVWTSMIMGVGLLGFVIKLLTLHVLLVTFHRRKLLYRWNLVHYLSELKPYVALMTWIILSLLLLTFEPMKRIADIWIFGSPGNRLVTIKMAMGLLVTTVLLAVKRHYMTGLAMSFNYTNYKDRIQESLFADHILAMLMRARHTYKFRSKWRGIGDGGTSIAGMGQGRFAATIQRFRNQSPTRRAPQQQDGGSRTSPNSPIKLASGTGGVISKLPRPSSNTELISEQTIRNHHVIIKTGSFEAPEAIAMSVRSVDEIFPSNDQFCGEIPQSMFKDGTSMEQQVDGVGEFTPNSPTSPASSMPPPPQRVPSMVNVINNPSLSTPTPTTTTTTKNVLSESDKKQQFDEFFALANKMMARYSTVSDYRLEIQTEALKMSSKLCKYLRPYDREYLLGQDMLPYLEDLEEFRRAVSLLKRHCDGGGASGRHVSILSEEEATKYAFSPDDLFRAIDGILMELYVTAKSMQTIETALGKVDAFFTSLVALLMIIVIAVIIGDAVKLLLALSTMLSGAAFAFGTSARNMFESMIFILVIHPFDVGDRVLIPLGTTIAGVGATTATSMAGNDAMDNLIISEMHLLSTVFERWDGVKLYVPNYVLAAKPIFNIRRSGSLAEIQRIHIDFSTPAHKIEELRRRLQEYTTKDSNLTGDFTCLTRVLLDAVENCNKLTITLLYQHSSNWQDMDAYLSRRSKMMTFIKETLDALQITYLPPVQRVALISASQDVKASLLGTNCATSGVASNTGSNSPIYTQGEIKRISELENSIKSEGHVNLVNHIV